MAPHPDRLLGLDPAVRVLAGALYTSIESAPIISPHGHVSAELLATNSPFPDPAALFITPDHYVTRLLHSSGVGLERLGLGDSDTPPREIWRTLCANWRLFAGTPVRYWLLDSLARVFDTTLTPDADTADELYDELAERLSRPEYRPRELLESFAVELLATTDDPADSLEYHRQLAAAPELSTRVVPTLRADAYMTPGASAWRERLDALSVASDQDCDSYRGLLAAIRNRRALFAQHGATATDCGVADAWATPLSDTRAEVLHRQGLEGSISERDARAYRRNMLFQFGLMAAEDGLVMQLHAGVIRNHHAPTARAVRPGHRP